MCIVRTACVSFSALLSSMGCSQHKCLHCLCCVCNTCALLQIGLDAMHKNGSVLTCHNAPWEDEFYSQLGASRAILDAGFNLDSFMLRYRGIDWTQQRNWGCNAKCVLTLAVYLSLGTSWPHMHLGECVSCKHVASRVGLKSLCDHPYKC